MKSLLKSITFASLFLCSSYTFACLNEITNKVESEIKSDRQLSISFHSYLKAGESLYSDRGDLINTFSDDKLIYSATGSYHSGWFNAAIVVNPKDCKIDFIGEFAAE